jgi:hypothetical protein
MTAPPGSQDDGEIPQGNRFPVLDVTAWQAAEPGDEPMGSAVKQWLEPPKGSGYAHLAPRWLFKQVRAKDVQGEWRTFGEDWSEKAVAELAVALGVPAAQVELATLHRTRGVVTPSFVRTPQQQFAPGNELLAGRYPHYPVNKTGQVPGYTLTAVREVLEPFEPPPGLSEDMPNAFAAFAGYLVLDALVANTDRHHENWGVIRTPGEPARLAPSYDHGTSLGFQEPDARKADLVENAEALREWTYKGRSRHFEGRPGLVELAADALAALPASAVAFWGARLEALEMDAWERILGRVPPERMSQADRMFASALLRVNRERLLDAC